MNEVTSLPKLKTSHFVLTRKNQKGQTAIFVALIFQVIFVFFALLINVGLLVHQKINLQQSTDLAAYYGAMKQAELLNMVAHVNFQIKQAYKLLTWRYRVLGTFGFRDAKETPPKPAQLFPFVSQATFSYNGKDTPNPDNLTCPGPDGRFGIQDVPFFCVGHAGFAGWPNPNENNCQLSCDGFNIAREIEFIPTVAVVNDPAYLNTVDGNTSQILKNSVDQVNAELSEICSALGPSGARTLSKFLIAYIVENKYRTQTIEMLARNLSLPANDMLDIDGKTILEGSKKTFTHNLTEANLTGFSDDAAHFSVENGFNSNKCKFQDGLGTKAEFLKKIEFQFINYFIHNCIPGAALTYKPEVVYSGSSPDMMGSQFSALPPEVKNILASLVVTDGARHTVGYEKNPYCVDYYAVRAYSEPTIPFLPLKKIRLNAVSIAKPFGGTIGPAYGKVWNKGETHSDYNDDDPTTRVDENLPRRFQGAVGGEIPLAQSIYYQPNFSLYVGDKLGLRDVDYLAAYHSALNKRDIGVLPGKSYSNINTANQISNILDYNAANAWPNYVKDWQGIADPTMIDFRDYDSLARNTSGMRYLEISAIAPNQFDIANYSIEPDFYNNYYKRLYNGDFDRIKNATGVTLERNDIRPDFGAIKIDASVADATEPLTENTFSVKDQILVKNLIFDASPQVKTSTGYPTKYSEVFKYLVSLQSSLLTGWTFLNFTTYDTFPSGPDINDRDKTMTFGVCKDKWNNTANAVMNNTQGEHFKTAKNENNSVPTMPGNCITGGRSGYSVKLVSPDVIRDANELENPLDDSFFNF